jgi:uncharacterized membrane protein YcaP (DUF421 family)
MNLIHAILGPDSRQLALGQECARAVVVLLVGVALIRLSGKRTFSRESPLDIVVTIVIGSNLSRALTGSAPFFGTLAASAVMVATYHLLTHACQRMPVLSRLLKGEPVRLVTDGVVDPDAMRRQAIAESDLHEALRIQSVGQIDEARLVTLENNGQISVLKT